MAYSSIHFARVCDAATPSARVDDAGIAFLAVEDGAARVVFSDGEPDRLVAFLYSMAREVVRAVGAAELERTAAPAPMLPEPLMESVPSYWGDPDVRPGTGALASYDGLDESLRRASRGES